MPRGFHCEACGAYNPFHLWVFAHWGEVITGRCGCGAVVSILSGHVVSTRKPRRKRTKRSTQ